MNKSLRKKRKRSSSSLIVRIMLGISLPLLCLTLIFSAIQLSSEMRAIHEFYQLESRFAFEAIHRALALASRTSSEFKVPSELTPLVRDLQNTHAGVELSLYDLHEHKLLFDTNQKWSNFDKNALESSLYEQQRGKPYIVRANRESEKLVAFIPLVNHEGNITMAARVQFPIPNINEALQKSRGMLIIIVLLILITGIFIGARLSNIIIKPIVMLNKATEQIVKGNLDQHVSIETGDEIENLAITFNKMSDALKEMKQAAQDANPLSGLPGNQGIFRNLKKRIHERQKFVLFHTDLDRFKVFNDHFGLAKGDEAIVATAELLKLAIQKEGSTGDFVGHQGGDDYVLIVSPQRAKNIAEFIIKEFDHFVVKKLYPKEDVERGYTMQLDRRRLAETGEEIMTEFPLLALSLAGVSNVKKDFADYFDCMSSAVSVKKEVKKTIESSYIIKE